jgi:gamma-glutamylputrescine oxidase
MRRDMLRVFPQLSDVGIDYAWGGLVDISMNRAPDFGRLSSSIYYLQGFSGHGVNITGIAGKILAETIALENSRFDLFSKLRHRPFPGGAFLRKPALMLAMLYYRLLDFR